MADKDFKVKTGLDLGTPLPLTEGGTGQTSASNALNAILPVQTSAANKFLQSDGTSTSWVAAAVVNNATFTGSSLVVPSGTNAERPASPVVGAIRLNTDQGTLEFYTGTAWGAIATFPQPPRNLVATDTGTSRALNNASASVAFDLPTGNGGSTITSYKITSSPGSFFATGASSPLVITGLQSNTSYTFTGTATNTIGEGAASVASSSILATTVPGTATIGAVTKVSATEVTVAFTAPVATGGKAISGYTIVSSPSISLTYSSSTTTSPITVTASFAANTAYTFTVAAVNANGTGVASSASSSITPNDPPTALELLVVGGGGTSGQSSSSNLGAGGGGAGGVQYIASQAISAGVLYNISVAAAGGSSQFYNFSNRIGGGNGGTYPGSVNGNAGAGGGGGGPSGSGGTGNQGSNGGAGGVNSGGSGGGSAGGGGTSGTVSNITGNAITYGSGGSGGSDIQPSNAYGLGSAGGAGTGNGGYPGTSRQPTAGITKAGGTGVVILAYPIAKASPNVANGSPTITSNANTRVYTFLGNGQIQW